MAGSVYRQLDCFAAFTHRALHENQPEILRHCFAVADALLMRTRCSSLSSAYPTRTSSMAPGERQVADSLFRAFATYRRLLAPGPAAPRTSAYNFAHMLPQHQLLRAHTRRFVQLHLAALSRQNEAAARTAAQVWRNSLLLAPGRRATLVLGVLRSVRCALRLGVSSSQGGQLRAKSALGAGGTLVFTLPVSLVPASPIAATARLGGRE